MKTPGNTGLSGRCLLDTQAENSILLSIHDREISLLLPLDIESIKMLWSKTYNTCGKPDWSHIYPYYHPEVVFQDSVQRIEGIDEFIGLCERLTRRCQSLQMEILSIAQGDDFILMDWVMTMSFNKYPSTPLYGSTKLVFHPDGRIIYQRDYYDLWGDIFNGIPYFKKTYRKFMRRHFG
jgi:limonene-1,2-epoxide hydrolase